MQKIITIAVFLLLSSNVFAQHEPIQPFEDLGIKVKVLTLSNGKYQESFPNDTLVRIGKIMYNRVTNEVVAVVKEDTLYGEFDLKPEVVSRWLSPDPLAAKYPESSPYVYTRNNPIIFIDPDGRDAILAIDKVNKSVTISTNVYWSRDSRDAVAQGTGKSNNFVGSSDWMSSGGVSTSWSQQSTVDIEGITYNVTYNVNVIEKSTHEDAVASFKKDASSNLMFVAESGASSNYSAETSTIKLNADQQKKGDGKTFIHEIFHAFGLGHNTYKDEKGKSSISSYDKGNRDIIGKDVKNTIQGALNLSNQVKDNNVKVMLNTGTKNNQYTIQNSDGSKGKSIEIPVVDRQKN